MKIHFPKRFLVGVVLYVVVGLLVGVWIVSDFSREDALLAQNCTSLADCWKINGTLLPALIIIWPLWILSSPLIVAGAFVVVFGGWWVVQTLQ